MIYSVQNSVHVNPDMTDTVHPPQDAIDLLADLQLKALPLIASNPELCSRLMTAAKEIRTEHRFVRSDSRRLDELADESVHLVLTSPPYWNIKEYESGEGQLGLINNYDQFVEELTRVFSECLRVLVPGGRMVVVVGDILVPRRTFGKHLVFPLHGTIQEKCRQIGFDNLAPIIWNKIGNVNREAGGNSSFLGKPYEPNAVIKNDIEYILFQRKPGGYRKVRSDQRLASVIPKKEFGLWFNQIWTLGGTSTRLHPAPFPLKLAERLIRMFSFVEDKVLDPFCGSGTTNLAAARWGRNSIGIDIEQAYIDLAIDRIHELVRNPRLFEESQSYDF